MIADVIGNWKLYAGPRSRLGRGFGHLERLLAVPPADGRVELDGGDIHAIVQTYGTLPAAERRWEAHRRYIDIQYVISGVELMGFGPVGALEPDGGYDAEREVAFFRPAELSTLRAPAGTFAVFFLQDAHRPGIADGAPGQVRKVVVKVRA
jgi:YhcH/YjgK/YiaL family protein